MITNLGESIQELIKNQIEIGKANALWLENHILISETIKKIQNHMILNKPIEITIKIVAEVQKNITLSESLTTEFLKLKREHVGILGELRETKKILLEILGRTEVD